MFRHVFGFYSAIIFKSNFPPGMRFAYVQVKSAIAEVIRKFEISVDPQMPKRENLKISPTEFLNVTNHKLMLNFKSI